MRGGVKWQIYSMRRSQVLYLPRDPTLSIVFYHKALVNGAFNDLLVLRGRITRKIRLAVMIQCFKIVAKGTMRLVKKGILNI